MTHRLVALVLIFLGLSLGVRAAEDPFVGSWKLEVAKSTYSPGPPSRGEILTSELLGSNGIKTTVELTDAAGKKIHESYSGSFDGKDYPVAGDPNADTTALKRIDAYTMVRTTKKAGKVTIVLRRVVSRDGKTLTVTATGTNAKGEAVHNVTVFEKQ